MKVDKNNNIINEAIGNLEKTQKLNKIARLCPIPIIIISVLFFIYFADQWNQPEEPKEAAISILKEKIELENQQEKIQQIGFIERTLNNSLYRDPFLLSIIFLFIYGQIKALNHFKGIEKDLNELSAILSAIQDNPAEKDYKLLAKSLNEFKDNPVKAKILKWIELGEVKEDKIFEYIMGNDNERENKIFEEKLSTHNAINRITLKLGFLGTLIGLIMTFPPMKRAIEALNGSGGEMKFVKDIAAAIEGDQYAILTTLMATGLSIFIELLTIGILEKIFSSQEVVQKYLDEWNLSCLQPAIKMNLEEAKSENELLKMQYQFNSRLVEIQKSVDKQIGSLQGYVEHTESELNKVLNVQNEFEKKMSNFQQANTRQLDSLTDLQLKTSENIEKLSNQNLLVNKFQQTVAKQQENLNKELEITICSIDKLSVINKTMNAKLEEVITNNYKHLEGIQDRQKEFTLQLEAQQRQSNQLTALYRDSGIQIEQLNDFIDDSYKQIDKIYPLQESISLRVNELYDFEKQYRSFIEARNQVTVPSYLEPA